MFPTCIVLHYTKKFNSTTFVVNFWNTTGPKVVAFANFYYSLIDYTGKRRPSDMAFEIVSQYARCWLEDREYHKSYLSPIR